MTITLQNGKRPELTVTYDNVSSVSFDYAMNLYSDADIHGNGVKRGTVLLVVHMYGGDDATFTARDWTIIPTGGANE